MNLKIRAWTDTEAMINCDDENTIRAPSFSIAIWHRSTRTDPRKDKKKTKSTNVKSKILILERQNKKTYHGTSAFRE